MANRQLRPRLPRGPVLHPLALAVASLLSTPVLAQTVAVNSPATAPSLPPVVVSATRTETPADQVSATVTAIGAQDIQRKQAADVKDLLKDQPGLSVRALPNRSSAAFYATGRGGNEGINIRGLEGNQVLLQTDGVRLPMVYASGPYFAGRADTVEIEAYKQVEILRGPSSTGHGSDGLAGAVSFVTKDPADLLTLGQPTQVAAKFGYASADRSWLLSPSVAHRSDKFEALLLAAVRRGHATQTLGDNDAPDNTRTTPNPQERRSDYVLGKLIFRIDPQQRLKLSAEHLDRRVDTDVYTLFGDPSYPTTTDVDAREDITRSMAKAEYSLTDPRGRWFQKFDASLYLQDALNRQFGFEARTNTSAWNTRERDTQYGEKTVGGSLQAESWLGGDTHRLVYGLDWSRAEVRSRKDGGNYLDGTLVTSGSSAFTVNRSFPNTDYTLTGLFVQDLITLAPNLTLTPGLRWDRFELAPQGNDPLYTNSQPLVTLTDDELSPKLGLLWQWQPMLGFVAQYAHGFRAPTPPQVNGGVTNLAASQPYRSIGNPDLKPETSDSFELGLRGSSQRLRYAVTVFRSTYDNFIAENTDVTATTDVPLEVGMPAATRTFQSVNLRDVVISGFEASVTWVPVKGWQLSAAYAHARGDQDDGAGEVPLRSIDPDKLVLSTRWEPGTGWGGEATARLVKRKARNPSTTGYTPPGYGVLDLAAWWEVHRNVSLNLALGNVFNKKYTEWADVRDLAATSTTVDAYTQPGRHLSASVQVLF